MIEPYVISLYLLCSAPNIVNTSDEAWNDHDQKILRSATKRCGEIYNEAPCVKLFHKTEPRSYRVICGKAN